MSQAVCDGRSGSAIKWLNEQITGWDTAQLILVKALVSFRQDQQCMSLCDYLRHPPPRLLQQSFNARKRTELFWPVIASDLSGQGQKALAFPAGQDYSSSAGRILILRRQLWAMAVWYVDK